jgi:hypothetical protein
MAILTLKACSYTGTLVRAFSRPCGLVSLLFLLALRMYALLVWLHSISGVWCGEIFYSDSARYDGKRRGTIYPLNDMPRLLLRGALQ